MTAHTELGGMYHLYGVSNEIGLRVTKDGYEPVSRRSSSPIVIRCTTSPYRSQRRAQTCWGSTR